MSQTSTLDAILNAMNLGPTLPSVIPPTGRLGGMIISDGPVNKLEIISSDDAKKLDDYLKSSKEFEVEVRLGYINNNNFITGIFSFTSFSRLLEALKKNPRFKVETSSSLVESISKIDIRRVTDVESGTVRYERKKKHNSFINHEYGYRVSQSVEEILDIPETYNPDFTRKIDRTSFISENIRIDLSIVKELKLTTGRKAVKYEVELERTGILRISEMVDAIKLILKGIGGGNILSLSQRRTVVAMHNNLLRESTIRPYDMTRGYWNKPENIKFKDILNEKFNPATTIKLDGERRMVLFLKDITAFVWAPREVQIIGDGVLDMEGTMIDVEYISKDGIKSFHAFDILFYKGNDVRNDSLKKRLNRLSDVVQKIPSKWGYVARLKKFYMPAVNNDLYTRVSACLDESTIYNTDGVILQPLGAYSNRWTRKWKPPEKLTIDFLLQVVKTKGNEVTYELLSSKKRDNVQFKGSEFHPHPGTIIMKDGYDGLVVELGWDEDSQEFILHRVRHDRERPNSDIVARSIWTDIMNPIDEATIRGHTLRVMRKYHNKSKKCLLGKFLQRGDILMDWGSGRGGDLVKWESIGLKKVYVVEPDSENSEILKDRLANLEVKTLDVQVIEAGAQETTKLSKAVGKNKIDVITTFFSLTYFPQTQAYYNNMLETINKFKPRKFIGIVLDGERVKDDLEKDRVVNDLDDDDAAEIETDAFQIYQDSMYKEDVYGTSIKTTISDTTSMVKDQKEWLFFFDHFAEEVEKMGYKLLKDDFLDHGVLYDRLSIEAKQFSSYNRAFIFSR